MFLHKFLTIIVWALLAHSALAIDAGSIEFFENHVRPILAKRCYACHSGAAQKIEAKLRLDHRSFIVVGGDSGPAIVEGAAGATNVADSLLIQAVRYEAFEMPPSGKLPDEEIQILEKWVAGGAVWPQEPVPQLSHAKEEFDLTRRRQEHWAWQPRVDPIIPATNEWTSSAVDSFIGRSMVEHGLKPNPKADRGVLTRRLYLDLLGVPPTSAELDAHLRDQDAAWYEKMVDKLLASPQFGVRFGRHWLDLVRYAESRGHEFDEDVPGATHYRNYVIRALNEDLPFDQFVTEQIAGDLIPNPRLDPARGWNESLIGTGFWHLGEWVHSPVDSRKDETDRFDNMIDVLSKSTMGLTVACARCHDHKFDAIGTADYYALAGFLRSSHYRMVRFETEVEHRQVERDRQRLRDSVQADLTAKLRSLLRTCLQNPAKFDGLHKRMTEQRAEGGSAVWKFATPLGSGDARLRADYTQSGAWICEGPGFGKGPVAAGSLDLNRSVPETARWNTFPAAHFDSYWAGLTSTLDSINKQNNYSQVNTSGRTLLTPTFELTSGELSYLIRGQGQAFVVVDSMRLLAGPLHGETKREFRDDKALPEYRWVTQSLQRYKGKRVHVEFAPIDGKPFEVVQVINGSAPELTSVEATAEAIRKTLAEVEFGKTDTGSIQRELIWGVALDAICANAGDWLSTELKEQSTDWKAAIHAWKEALDLLATKTRWESNVAMAMIDGTGENHPILIRGSPEHDGPMVERRMLEALSGSRVNDPGSGRLQLAREIVDPQNPLTARVLVNRLWHHLLGRGIVATTDDFGVQGQRPTHPELLDFLANRLIEHKWSVKRAVRGIVTSETYQRSSVIADSTREKDPDNVWLSRARVRRLEAEAIRDTLMSIADRLDVKLEGTSIPVHLTEFLEGRGRPGSSGPADSEFRRSIFISVRRNFLVPMMSTFDAPNPFSSMGRRNVSSVPAQSLTLLNDPFVHQLAKDWSQSMLALPATTDQQRLETMYLTAFARLPTQAEQASTLEYIAAQKALDRTQHAVWQDVAHVLMNMKELILRF
jgi:Protein of unknown function (DUF1553)/Protein of unknown function (DUF1549)/Planctomycete cytochrome C